MKLRINILFVLPCKKHQEHIAFLMILWYSQAPGHLLWVWGSHRWPTPCTGWTPGTPQSGSDWSHHLNSGKTPTVYIVHIKVWFVVFWHVLGCWCCGYKTLQTCKFSYHLNIVQMLRQWSRYDPSSFSRHAHRTIESTCYSRNFLNMLQTLIIKEYTICNIASNVNKL